MPSASTPPFPLTITHIKANCGVMWQPTDISITPPAVKAMPNGLTGNPSQNVSILILKAALYAIQSRNL